MAGPLPVRGTRDLIGAEAERHRVVIDTARRIAALYGCSEWMTPILEDTAVFARTLGDTSDVVAKEMYSFADRGGDSITLRPEGTAGICRALISNGLTQTLPQKIFYAGPMFRYERPQKGRYRQFHQLGMEVIGPAEPLADAEAIAAGRDILAALGVAGSVTLELNTLGDGQSRAGYRAALIAHFTEHRAALSSDSQARLERNPLRILDSKDMSDREVVAQAPTILPFLSPEASRFWDALRRWLDAFGVPFVENPRIVRGLDYYSHTAFEFITHALGAQGTVLAGGRYDGLIAQLGGPAVPAVGWAAGIDRLALLMAPPVAQAAPIAVVPASETAEPAAIGLLQQLRQAGVAADLAYRGTLKKRLDRANRLGARAAVILTDDSIAAGTALVKDLITGEQAAYTLGEVINLWMN